FVWLRQEQDPLGHRLCRRHPAEGRDEPRLGRVGRYQESANARLPRRRSRAAAYRGDRGDGGEVSRSVSFLRVGFFAGLHQIETLLDLAQESREIAPLLRRQL